MKLKAWTNYTLVILALFFASPVSVAYSACTDKTLVVLGDSLSAGFGLPPGKAFPQLLGLALAKKGHCMEVRNAGVSGDTTSGGLARLDWSVGDDVDAVLVELGANDALRGIPAEITRKNLEEIVVRLKARNIEVMLAGMLAPPNMGKVYGAQFSAVYTDLAENHNIAFYPFFLEGVAGDPALNLADGIHPNEAGINVIVSNLLPFMEENLATIYKN